MNEFPPQCARSEQPRNPEARVFLPERFGALDLTAVTPGSTLYFRQGPQDGSAVSTAFTQAGFAEKPTYYIREDPDTLTDQIVYLTGSGNNDDPFTYAEMLVFNTEAQLTKLLEKHTHIGSMAEKLRAFSLDPGSLSADKSRIGPAGTAVITGPGGSLYRSFGALDAGNVIDHRSIISIVVAPPAIHSHEAL